MKKTITTYVIWPLIAAVITLAGCTTSGESDSKGEGSSGTAHQGGHAAHAEAATVYTCPMHPGVRQDHPGKCPICGMFLQPLEPELPAGKEASSAPATGDATDPHAGHSTGPGEPRAVVLDARAVQMAGIKTSPATVRDMRGEVRTVGRVDYDERAVKVVSARVDGRIERLLVDYTGARVKKGQPLLELYSPQLLATQRDYLAARRNPASDSADSGHGASDLSGAALRRLELWGMTAVQRAKLEKSGEASPTLAVHSPGSGTVIEKGAIEGAYVKEGDLLFKLADLGSVWVLAEVYEQDLGRIEVGTPATVSLPSRPGQPLSGQVSFIVPGLSPTTRTARVRIPLENPGETLLPGMTVDAVLEPAAGRSLAVPETALVRTGGSSAMVYVQSAPGTFTPRRVTTGLESEGYVAVQEGLQEGDEVVVSGAFLIDSQTQLTGGQSALWSGATEVKAPPAGHQHGTRGGAK